MTALDDTAPIPTLVRLSVLGEALEQKLRHRRAGRASRQHAAREREARLHHDRFLNDPMMRGQG